MFDDPNAGTGLLVHRANENRNIALQERARAQALELEVIKLRAENAGLVQALKDLQLKFVIEKAHAGGLDAWVDAIKAESPSIPSFAPSGRRYRDGDAKSRGRLVYEGVFDRIARDHRISDPTQYRAD